jgi:hypothetical protein
VPVREPQFDDLRDQLAVLSAAADQDRAVLDVVSRIGERGVGL